MRTVRKNFKFDGDDEHTKIVLKFLDLLSKRQSDFIVDLIYSHLNASGINRTTKLTKSIVDSVAKAACLNALNSSTSSDINALVSLVSQMIAQNSQATIQTSTTSKQPSENSARTSIFSNEVEIKVPISQVVNKPASETTFEIDVDAEEEDIIEDLSEFTDF